MGLKQLRIASGFVIGLSIGLTLSACASFTYRHYVLNLEDGTLQGPNPSDDLPISVCARTPEGYRCITMKIEEFYRLKINYEKMQMRLEELERNCNNP